MFKEWSINIACISPDGKNETLPFSLRLFSDGEDGEICEYRCNLCGYTFKVPIEECFGEENEEYIEGAGLNMTLPIPNAVIYERLHDHLLGEEYVLQKCKGYNNNQDLTNDPK